MGFRRCLRQALACCSVAAVVLAAEAAAENFAQAIEPRVFAFPRDHGAHPEYRTEWWYLTGALEDQAGNPFGFQATWFRSALVPEASTRPSRLAARDLYFFHGALTDVTGRSFAHEADISRGASSWAGARLDDLDVHLFHHRFRRDGDGFVATFHVEGRRVHLRLTSEREPLLHGASPGLSRKGSEPGQASYYYSLTRMRATGTIEREPGGDTIDVGGLVWLDREFGSNQLGEEQIGWDWFSVALSDGTDLMLYQLRREDGSIEPRSSGTLRTARGERLHLDRDEFTIEVLDRWTSPETGAEYPAKWRIRVPSREVDLAVRPLLANQELRTGDTTGVDYWEGLSDFRGRIGSTEVSGRGYIELVGYAGAFRGL